MDDSDDDSDREAILARRRKLVAMALAGLTSAAGCGGDDGDPMPCLTLFDASHDGALQDAGNDAAPMPCLGAPLDAGGDAGELDAGDLDAGELDGSTDAEPMACLRMAPPTDGGDAA